MLNLSKSMIRNCDVDELLAVYQSTSDRAELKEKLQQFQKEKCISCKGKQWCDWIFKDGRF